MKGDSCGRNGIRGGEIAREYMVIIVFNSLLRALAGYLGGRYIRAADRTGCTIHGPLIKKEKRQEEKCC